MIFLLIACAAGSQNAFSQTKRKILYYRNPMDPSVTSPVFMKDSMGMDYIPVYAKEPSQAQKVSGIHVPLQQQQLIGLKTGLVEKRDLIYEIRASAQVAFDPDLFVAQTSYIEALKTLKETANGSDAFLNGQSKSLLEASRRNLYLEGMSDSEIDELAKTGKADDSLYYPGTLPTAWVYAAIYENEALMTKPGQKVTFEPLAFPGKMFHGIVAGVSPILDARTRTVRLRIRVDDPKKELRPQMFGTALISVDLGKKLAVDQDAVLNTGMKQIVYVVHKGNIFEMRKVTLGTEAKGYYEVLSGLQEGQKVVTSGNFMIDSESRIEGFTK